MSRSNTGGTDRKCSQQFPCTQALWKSRLTKRASTKQTQYGVQLLDIAIPNTIIMIHLKVLQNPSCILIWITSSYTDHTQLISSQYSLASYHPWFKTNGIDHISNVGRGYLHRKLWCLIWCVKKTLTQGRGVRGLVVQSQINEERKGVYFPKLNWLIGSKLEK